MNRAEQIQLLGDLTYGLCELAKEYVTACNRVAELSDDQLDMVVSDLHALHEASDTIAAARFEVLKQKKASQKP
jgi:hypothetical protein